MRGDSAHTGSTSWLTARTLGMRVHQTPGTPPIIQLAPLRLPPIKTPHRADVRVASRLQAQLRDDVVDNFFFLLARHTLHQDNARGTPRGLKWQGSLMQQGNCRPSPRSAPAPPHTRAPASHLRQAQLGRVHDGLVHSERSDQDLRGGGRQARWVWTQTCQRWQAGKAPTDGATTHPCPRSSSRGTHCPSRRLASRRRYAQRTACSCGHSRVCPRSSARSWPAAQPACLQQNGRAGGGLSSSWQVQQNLLPATAQPVACIAGGGLPSMHPPSSVVLPQPEGPMMACGAGLGAINNYATVMVNNAARIPAV